MQIHQNDFEVKLAGNSLFVRVDLERTSRFWGHWQVDRHSNAEYEMHIILRGTGQVDVKDQHYTLTKGQAILIPPILFRVISSGSLCPFFCRRVPSPFRFSSNFRTATCFPLLRRWSISVTRSLPSILTVSPSGRTGILCSCLS